MLGGVATFTPLPFCLVFLLLPADFIVGLYHHDIQLSNEWLRQSESPKSTVFGQSARASIGCDSVSTYRRLRGRVLGQSFWGLPRYVFERQTIVEHVGATAQSFGRTLIAAADLNEFLCGQSFVNHL